MHQSLRSQAIQSRTLWVSVVLLLTSIAATAQQLKPDLLEDVFLAVDQRPRFPGGLQVLNRYLLNHVRYPDRAASTAVTGTVVVGFVVESDGELTQVEVLKGIGFDCDEEAIRVVKTMPRWKPGTRAGRATRAKSHISISFGMN